MNMDNILRTDFFNVLPPEFLTSMIVMLIIIVLSFVIYHKQKHYDPLKDSPKGIVNVTEKGIEIFDNYVTGNMGPDFSNFGGYIMVLGMYIFFGFLVGMTGFPNFIYLGEDSLMNSSHLFSGLSNPFTNIAFPLDIAILTFAITQAIAVKYSHWGYFKQFIAPIPFINLIEMWAPLISLSLRLFGNAFAGFCLSTIVYQAIDGIAGGWGLVLVPGVMPFFHAYFDVFSGFIQALIFVTLSMMDIAQGAPSIEQQMEKVSLKNHPQNRNVA